MNEEVKEEVEETQREEVVRETVKTLMSLLDARERRRREGAGKRFDVKKIADELVKICKGGKRSVTMGTIKEVVRKYDKKQTYIYWNQLRSIIERIDAMEGYAVYVVDPLEIPLRYVVKKK